MKIIYLVVFNNNKYVRFDTMSEFHEFMYRNCLYIESSISKHYCAVRFVVYDEFGDDIGELNFIVE